MQKSNEANVHHGLQGDEACRWGQGQGGPCELCKEQGDDETTVPCLFCTMVQQLSDSFPAHDTLTRTQVGASATSCLVSAPAWECGLFTSS